LRHLSSPTDFHLSGVPSPIIHPLTSMPSFDTIASPRPRSSFSAGKIICHILPERISLPPRQPPPPDALTCIIDIASPSPVPSATVSALLAPATPPTTATSATSVPPFPKVVIVNPTPHPTPPATPLSSHQLHHTGMNPISCLPSQLTPGRLPASPSRTPGLVSATSEYISVDPSAVTALAVPHRLQVLPQHLTIPPQYAPRPPTSQLARRPPGITTSTRPMTTPSKNVTVPEFPTMGQPVLSHQSRFFLRESPEQIDSSPDRAGSALSHADGDDESNKGGDNSELKASFSGTAQRTVSGRSDSLDADGPIHTGKALTATSGSVGSKDSNDSASLPPQKKASTTNTPPAAITNTTATAATRRKAGHQVAARPVRPLIARMNSRMASQQKRTKSTSNMPTAPNPGATKATSQWDEAGTKAEPKDKAREPPSPVTLVHPTLTPTNATVTAKQQGPPAPALKRRGNSTTSHERRTSTGNKVDLQRPPKASPVEKEPPTTQSPTPWNRHGG
jgi:hypothetical protein